MGDGPRGIRTLDETYVALLRARVELFQNDVPGKTQTERYDLVHRLLGPLQILELTEAWLQLREMETSVPIDEISTAWVPDLSRSDAFNSAPVDAAHELNLEETVVR